MENRTELKSHVSESAFINIEKWLNESKYKEYKAELEQLIADKKWSELEDSFFKVVEFGTGGRRGTTGVGSNRINRVTIGESAQALCLYAQKADPTAPQRGVVIACDTRLSSPELSRFTAQVCAANGFKTYIFDSFRSTPELSFAVRHLKAAIGIVISASHNPPADNGFKAYWNDGAQLVAPHDKGVLAEADAISEILSVPFEEAVDSGAIVVIGKDVDDAYIAAASKEAVGSDRDLAIVYSPLHGAGQTNAKPVLESAGFKDIRLVEEQMIPDGRFPTIANGKANPEERGANDMAVDLLLESQADIAITNDPDADRIGVVVRVGESPFYLSGNQSAVLAADYVLSQMKENGKDLSNHYLAKTIVTTDMLTAIGDYYGVKTYGNMLVGFKYIGELIRNKESTDEVFVLGGEESYGFLKGTYARDKDGAGGALTLAESAAFLKKQGKTLYDRLLELYQREGIYVERLDNVACVGADGFEKMQAIMASLRTDPPKKIGDHDVTATIDYNSLERKTIATDMVESVDCVSGSVFVLECGDARRRITIRPSGTEPKIKFYVQWFEEARQGDLDGTQKQYDEVVETLALLSRDLEKQLLG